jgi:hypothetical protein
MFLYPEEGAPTAPVCTGFADERTVEGDTADVEGLAVERRVVDGCGNKTTGAFPLLEAKDTVLCCCVRTGDVWVWVTGPAPLP